MKRFSIALLVGVFTLSVAFAATKGSVKAPKMQKLERTRMIEGEASIEARGPSYWNKAYSHSNRNGAINTLVDSSSNGYGMVVSVTKPIDTNSDGEVMMAYRQYCGANTTHGQLGGAISEDGEEFEAFYNLNANGNPPWGGGVGVGNGSDDTSQARYPSAVASDDYPYAIWNEYTGLGNGYGGQLYWTYDNTGWGLGSFTYPELLDLLWDESKDLWAASPDMFYDDDAGMMALAVSAADWTRSNNYYFRSDIIDPETGYIVMGVEQIIMDENCLTPGTDTGSYNTGVTVNINEDGFGVQGIIGLFPGGEEGTSDISNYHQPIFKVTEDYGITWHGPDASDECSFYYLGDDVYLDMIASWDEYDGVNDGAYTYMDECDGYAYDVIDFWSYYDFDIKLDADGNIHILMSVVPSDDYYVFWIEGAGWYHFTIDTDHLDNPGQVNTSSGWNYSQISEMQDTWIFTANDGDTSIWETMASLSFSPDDADVVWVALDRKNEYACGEISDDFGNDDPCDDTYTYDGVSSDIYVYKSSDGGSTWWNPLNASETMDDVNDYPEEWSGECPVGLEVCGPEEMYPHAPQWSTSDEMLFMYQMPNWGFNEIGDMLGPDHMNYVYAAKVEITSDTEPGESDCDSISCTSGDLNDDGAINVQDIVAIINHILGTIPLDEMGLCAGDLNSDGNIDVLDVVAVVNIILGNRSSDDASSAEFIRTEDGLSMKADGYVGAFELTLTHDENFTFELVSNNIIENAFGYHTDTKNNTTKIISVTPLNGKVLITDDSFSVKEVVVANSEEYIPSKLVDSYVLVSSYPNPFNPSTTISYDLIGDSHVDISIYNVMGQKVATLVNDFKATGTYSVVWNATNSSGIDMPSGVYIMRLNTNSQSISNKLTLLR